MKIYYSILNQVQPFIIIDIYDASFYTVALHCLVFISNVRLDIGCVKVLS